MTQSRLGAGPRSPAIHLVDPAPLKIAASKVSASTPGAISQIEASGGHQAAAWQSRAPATTRQRCWLPEAASALVPLFPRGLPLPRRPARGQRHRRESAEWGGPGLDARCGTSAKTGWGRSVQRRRSRGQWRPCGPQEDRPRERWPASLPRTARTLPLPARSAAQKGRRNRFSAIHVLSTIVLVLAPLAP